MRRVSLFRPDRLEDTMADPFAKDPNATLGGEASRAKDDLNARFQDLRRDAAASVKSAADTISPPHGQATPGDVGSTVSSLRDQAAQTTNEAKGAAASIAEQARSRLTEIVDQQKEAGADRIAGVAKAAQSAAGDLERTNPQMARLVRAAAENVDRLADDVRSRDLGDVLATLTQFGREQPVAFFGGAVVAGFILARFLKSDAPVASGLPQATSSHGGI